MDSILMSMRKAVGLDENCDDFDTDLLFQINAALSSLTQLGVGPKDGFVIYDESATWSNLLGKSKNLEMVKTYIQAKVKLGFDTASLSGTMVDVLKETIRESEFRITVAVDAGNL